MLTRHKRSNGAIRPRAVVASRAALPSRCQGGTLASSRAPAAGGPNAPPARPAPNQAPPRRPRRRTRCDASARSSVPARRLGRRDTRSLAGAMQHGAARRAAPLRTAMRFTWQSLPYPRQREHARADGTRARARAAAGAGRAPARPRAPPRRLSHRGAPRKAGGPGTARARAHAARARARAFLRRAPARALANTMAAATGAVAAAAPAARARARERGLGAPPPLAPRHSPHSPWLLADALVRDCGAPIAPASYPPPSPARARTCARASRPRRPAAASASQCVSTSARRPIETHARAAPPAAARPCRARARARRKCGPPQKRKKGFFVNPFCRRDINPKG